MIIINNNENNRFSHEKAQMKEHKYCCKKRNTQKNITIRKQLLYCIIENYIDYWRNSSRNPLLLYHKYSFANIPGHEKMFSISGDSQSKVINRAKFNN